MVNQKLDNTYLGLALGMLSPILGLILFKVYKFGVFTFKETFQYIFLEPGFKTLSVGLSLSLLLNALFFTLFINAGKDKTAKGIFIFTLIYGAFILVVKTIY